MAIDVLKRCALFLTLVLAQALVFGRIQLFGCAIPLIYTYFVITFRRNLPHWASLLSSFCMGLTIDMFSNTPGMASASLTLIGALQPYLLELFLPRDAEENIKSSAATLGWPKFSTFTIILVFIYCLVFFSIEALSFFNWLLWLESVVGSAVLTIALILTLDSLRKK
jgi:rod shape-determining protein MreD